MITQSIPAGPHPCYCLGLLICRPDQADKLLGTSMDDPAFSRVFVVCGKAAEVSLLASHSSSLLAKHLRFGRLRGTPRRGVLHGTGPAVLSSLVVMLRSLAQPALKERLHQFSIRMSCRATSALRLGRVCAGRHPHCCL